MYIVCSLILRFALVLEILLRYNVTNSSHPRNVSFCEYLDQTGNAFAIMSQTAKIAKIGNP